MSVPLRFASLPIQLHVPIAKTRGVAIADVPVFRLDLDGELDNIDTRVPLS
jgi:hypothetical protein